MEFNEEIRMGRKMGKMMALERGKKRKQYQGMTTHDQVCWCRIYSQWESLGSVYDRINSV